MVVNFELQKLFQQSMLFVNVGACAKGIDKVLFPRQTFGEKPCRNSILGNRVESIIYHSLTAFYYIEECQ